MDKIFSNSFETLLLLQLEDDRFKAIFSDARFEVDKSEEAYRLLAPVRPFV